MRSDSVCLESPTSTAAHPSPCACPHATIPTQTVPCHRSYYGGNLYYNAAGGNPSVHIGAGGSVHYGNASHHHNNAGGGGSVHFPGLLLSSNPSVHGSVHFPNQDASTHGQQRGSTAGGSLRNGNAAGAALQGAGGSLKNGTAAGAALQGTGGSLKNGSAAGAALQGTGGSLRNGSAAGAAVGALSRASSKSLGVPSVAGAYSEGNLAAAAGGDVASSENALAAAAAGEAHASVGGAAGPSLRSLVAVAAAAAAAEQAGGRMPKVGSTASLLALANPGGGDSVHGGSSYGGPSAGPSAHGGAAAIGALAAAGYTTSHLKPPLPPSAASGMQRQSSEVGAGLAAPVDPAAITLARASSASSTSFTAGSAAGGAAPFCLLATGSQRGMPPPPPVALPPGMTTLLLDPAQRHNLQNLNQLLGGQEGAEHAGAPSGGAARSLGGSRKGAKAGDALSGGDASVHRKMLALMALDQAAFASATEMCELPPDDTLPAVAAGSGPGGAGASSGAAAPFRTFQPPSHNNPQQALLLSEKCTLTDSCPMPPKPPALGASAAAAGGASQDAAGDGAGSQAVTPDASVSVTSPFASGPANASMGGAGAARSGGGAGGAGGGGGFGKGMGTIHEDKRLSTDLPPGQRPVFSSSLSGLPEGGAGAGAAAAAATGGSIRGGSAFAAAAVGQGTGGAGAAGTGSGRGSHKGSVRGSGKGQAAGLSAGAGAADLKKGAHFVDATQQVRGPCVTGACLVPSKAAEAVCTRLEDRSPLKWSLAYMRKDGTQCPGSRAGRYMHQPVACRGRHSGPSRLPAQPTLPCSPLPPRWAPSSTCRLSCSGGTPTTRRSTSSPLVGTHLGSPTAELVLLAVYQMCMHAQLVSMQVERLQIHMISLCRHHAVRAVCGQAAGLQGRVLCGRGGGGDRLRGGAHPREWARAE